MKPSLPLPIIALTIATLAGCAQQPQQTFNVAPPGTSAVERSATLRHATSGKIQHVIIIVQENRSPDNLFQDSTLIQRGANIVNYGLNSKGQKVQLQSESLTAPYDLAHRHSAFTLEYDNGKLDRFDLEKSHCERYHTCPPKNIRAYGYVPQNEVQPYFTLAETYAFADDMFQTNQGPSFPAHQYIISGTSTTSKGSNLRAAENPLTAQNQLTGGCDSPYGSQVIVINQYGQESQQKSKNSPYPCFDRPTLMDLLDAKGLTWQYYQEHTGAGLWKAPDAIKHIWDSSEFSTDVISPPNTVLTNIGNGTLASVAWVTPTLASSDHTGNNGTGPSWVNSVVTAMGNSPYWSSSVIFVLWDDWGGWYDHVKPPIYNSYELGFRVPLIVISPYAKAGYISHKQHEFGSILKFIEENFGLGSLGTTDVRADDLSDCFNFGKAPRRFVPIRAPLGAEYFLHQPDSHEAPDDDF